jgi:plasmid stabilization system protein ParE
MEIKWSRFAEEDFDHNISYLLSEWNPQVAKDFITKTERVLFLIGKTPKAFKKHKATQVHIVPITQQITLFYEVRNKEILLLRFWNNYKNPRKLTLK